MKKTLIFILILGLAFFLGGCNDPDGTGGVGGGDGDGEDIVFNWGIPGTMLVLTDDTSANYKGREINLADCPNRPATWGEMSEYGEAILFAILYDEDGDEIVTKTNGLAQFHLLLEGSSGWGDDNKLATANNLMSQVDVSASPTGKLGKPGKLLVQGNETYAKGDVAKVEVRTLTLKPKVSDVTLVFVYSSPAGAVTASANRVIFNNASYSTGAVKYEFDQSDLPLTGKKVVVDFKITEGYDSTKHYQIHIQAANGLYDYNGRHNENNASPPQPQPGQFYVWFDDYPDDPHMTAFDTTTGAGTFEIDGDALIAATAFNSDTSGNGTGANFNLTAFRIVNNGDTYGGADKEKSYTLAINEVKIVSK